MKDSLTEHELRELVLNCEYALGMMKSLEAQHPTAKITYNLAVKRVDITYPLPKDSVKINAFVKQSFTPLVKGEGKKRYDIY